MIKTSIDLSFTDQIRSGLALLTGDMMMEVLTIVAEQVGLFCLELVKNEYPPPQVKKSVADSWTDKQTKWWWYWMNQIAKGNTPPDSLRGWKAAYDVVEGRKTLVIDQGSGYIRTGTLVRGITYEIEVEESAVNIRVGTGLASVPDAEGVATYAQYVIDVPPPEGKQSYYHQGNWKPLVEILQESQKEIEEFMIATTFDELDKRLKMLGMGPLVPG